MYSEKSLLKIKYVVIIFIISIMKRSQRRLPITYWIEITRYIFLCYMSQIENFRIIKLIMCCLKSSSNYTEVKSGRSWLHLTLKVSRKSSTSKVSSITPYIFERNTIKANISRSSNVGPYLPFGRTITVDKIYQVTWYFVWEVIIDYFRVSSKIYQIDPLFFRTASQYAVNICSCTLYK